MVLRNALQRCLAVAFVSSLAIVAHAEEVKPYPACAQTASDPDVSGAKAAFQAGNVSFNEADYPRAILYWEDAFRRDCSATSLLFNLARAYELNGQKRQALVALETYLEREPNSSEKPQIQRRIEVLRKAIESEAPPPAPATDPPPATATPAAAPQAAEQPVTTAKTPRRPVLPLVVAGVGGAVFLLGGASWLVASGEVDKYAKQCGDTAERDLCPDDVVAKGNDARKRQQAAGAVTLVGLPVMVGGLIWYFASPKTSARTTVAPTVGKNFVGLAVDGKF